MTRHQSARPRLFSEYFITLEPHGISFDQILHTYTFYHCPDTGMKNDDEAGRRGQ